MSHGLPNFFGATAAWLCLAPVAFARGPLSMPSTPALAYTPAHYVTGLSFFSIWMTGGVLLALSGILAFVPSRLLAPESGPLPGLAQAVRRTELDLAWTVIPLLVLVFFLG